MAGQHRAGLRRGHRFSGIAGLVLLGAASLFAAVPAAAQSEYGQVRLGHLSPTTPVVDIYLTAPGAPAPAEPTVPEAGYGALTAYQPLVPGRWTVELRPAGAAAGSEAALSAALDVVPGSAQSLLFFDTGTGGAVQGQLVTDDLDPAAAQSGRVRIIQGAAGVAPVEMQAAGGPRLASGLQYGTVTDYATVDARAWDVAIASGDRTLQATLDVGGGSVSTVLLTRDETGALSVTPVVDVPGTVVAAQPTSVLPTGAPAETPAEPPAGQVPALPRGGVPAGGGATAGGPDPAPVLLGLAGAVLLAFALSGRPLRRSTR